MTQIRMNGPLRVIYLTRLYPGVNSGLFFSVFMSKLEFGYILRGIDLL